MNDLLRQAQEGTPVIKDEQAIFVWLGPKAPQLIGDWTDWDGGPPITLTQAAPELWTHTLTLPQDTYLEYAFWQNNERVTDPFNPRTVPNGMGDTNHFFYMPGGAPTRLTRRKRNVPRGKVTRHTVEDGFLLVGGERTVYLYQPESTEPCPLLVVLDGQDYRRMAKLIPIVDTLIAEKRIQPIALAMIHHGRQARGIEYACSEAHLAVLTQKVLPLAQQELALVDIETNPGAYGIMGASMGGLQALYVGLRACHIFGHVLCQSGAFTLGDHDTVIWDLVQHKPTQPIKLWMDAGRYELLLKCNQRMHKLLLEKGYDIAYREYNGGHNYTSWRNDLWRGLEHLFGPTDTTES